MRQHNKYLDKVRDELSIYQKYLIDENTQLTPTQAENWDKIDAVRACLREGLQGVAIEEGVFCARLFGFCAGEVGHSAPPFRASPSPR